MTTSPPLPIAIIGGGPAGLMAAETLTGLGRRVCLYEAMPTVGRKFLRAGVGGLNLTHSEPFEQFLGRYGAARARLEPLLRAFGPGELIRWANELGFETFTGTSGRVFPVGMKASPLLRAWLARLEQAGVQFFTGWKWLDVEPAPEGGLRLQFATPSGAVEHIPAAAGVLALGGGSWPRLGSTGGWVDVLQRRGVPIRPLRPANCGFDVRWSEHIRARFDGAPLKAIALTFGGIRKQGEFILTREGLEGSLIYAFSAAIRDEIEQSGQAVISLDLAPDWDVEKLTERLARPRGGRSMASHLEKAIGLKGVKAALVWEFIPREQMNNPAQLARAIKALPVSLVAPRPLAEAISTAGGVDFAGLDERLMLKTLPGLFCAGEMLDWEAPTGGYLLTASFASGRWAALGAAEWLSTPSGG